MSVDSIARPVHLSEIGQRVCVAREHADALGLPPDEPFTVTMLDPKNQGDGDDGFVRLRDNRGRLHPRWVRVKELVPAPTALPENKLPLHGQKISKEIQTMSATDTLNALAEQISRERAIPFNLAAIEAGIKLHELATTGRRAEIAEGQPVSSDTLSATIEQVRSALAKKEEERNLTAAASAALSLSAHKGEDFDTFAMRVAAVRGISLREAIHVAGQLAPDLAAAR